MRGLLMMLTQYLFLIIFIKAYAVGIILIASTCQGNSNEYPHICFYKEIDANTWAVTLRL